ncbi:MAG: polymorphic toxin-type HINT domain-containing protein [Pirellula sp.]
MNYSGPTLTQLDEQYSQREDYFSKYDITGNATGVKNDDGSVSWTLDAKILDYSDVDYDYFSLYTTTETNTLDFFSNRVATFDAAKATRSTVVGGGTISPQPGGDTGGLTATESKSRSGDTEVSIIFAQTDTGEAATGLERPVEKTDLELELEAMFASGEEEYTGTEGESGSGSSGQGTSADGSYSGRWLPTVSEVWGVTSAGFKGVAQGACNIVNGVQDAAVGVVNVAIAVPNGIASGIDYVTGATDPHYQIRIPYVDSPDWSRNRWTEEGGTPGGWDDMHGWSKFAGGEGVMSLITGGASKAASAVDDLGRCGNWLAKFVHGGCFVAGTKVTVSELPYSKARESQVWSETEWLSNNDYSYSPSPRFGEKRPGDEGLGSEKFEVRSGNASSSAVLDFLTSHASYLKPALQVPIEQVPLGARVPTKNPKPWEYDDSLPDPVQADWAKISITMRRTDGGIIDAELIRPRWWIAHHKIVAGQLLPMNIEELQVKGTAMVTSTDDCPEIAGGKGSVVTATFMTQEVNTLVRAEIIGADGTIEIIEGTPIHPIWSVDRNDWVSLGELIEGESLQAADGFATVLSIALVSTNIPVYNIEVHGEHVYQVGDLALLVHNTCTVIGRMDDLKAFDDIPADVIDTWRKTGLGDNVPWAVNRGWILDRFKRGDSFAIATDPRLLPEIVNGFKAGGRDGYFTAREFDLLKKLGVDVIEIWE